LGDTGVNAGLNQLRNRARQGRFVYETPAFQHMVFLDQNPVEHHTATGGGALPKGIPIINHLHTGCIAAYPDLHTPALLIRGSERNPMREQSASGVKTCAANAQAAICCPSKMGSDVRHHRCLPLILRSCAPYTCAVAHPPAPTP